MRYDAIRRDAMQCNAMRSDTIRCNTYSTSRSPQELMRYCTRPARNVHGTRTAVSLFPICLLFFPLLPIINCPRYTDTSPDATAATASVHWLFVSPPILRNRLRVYETRLVGVYFADKSKMHRQYASLIADKNHGAKRGPVLATIDKLFPLIIRD